MRDRIEDFWYAYGDMIKMVTSLVGSVIAIIVVVGVFLGWFEKDYVKEEQEEFIEEEYQNDFLELSRDESVRDALTVSILLNDPFFNNERVSGIARYIVATEKKNGKPKAIRIKIYQREIVHFENLEPSGIIEYRLKDGWEETIEKPLKAYKNHKFFNNYESLSKVYLEDVLAIEKEEEERDKVVTDVGGVEIELDDWEYLDMAEEDKTLLYLTDDEYEDFKKIVYYSILYDSSGIRGGLGLFIFDKYDLVQKQDEKKYNRLYDEWERKVSYALKYGEPVNMYDNMRGYLMEYHKGDEDEIYELVRAYEKRKFEHRHVKSESR